MKEEVRIDKFLWAVRLFKTRSLASDACKKGRILLNNALVKSSRTVKRADEIQVKRPPVTYTYRVLDLADKRMGAKLVGGFIQDITSAEQLEILELQKINTSLNREKGLGRPTKRDRRRIEDFNDQSEDNFLDNWD